MKLKFKHRYVTVIVAKVDGKQINRYRSYERRVDADDYCYRLNKSGPMNETAYVVDQGLLSTGVLRRCPS